ncbi:MAG: hypothetical protein KF760_22450 [Candidatus Eremiobacteraeota bacterium]|nr:hypothetical protein [Candidatus Eremiobacteraeota bacterium]MCW5866412.1 hypothetical protein [Candidatus Eremiobacteraeota bacterium]
MLGVLRKLRELPLYQENLQWGLPRRGHPEGSLANHIADLEANLEKIQSLLRPDEEDRLRLLIHVHDICKPEAWVGVDSDHPHNHALMARRLLEQLGADPVLLNITQYHDDGYILFQYYRRSQAMRPRLRKLLQEVQDVELFVLFFLIDSCTPGKRREPVDWFLLTVAQEYRLSERIEQALRLLD